ncbi:hypothetical protein BMS3Abin06_00801 [bacterium BMS3Abin06]|nr:hypothetical protein BMS3Abin06_00801 [bacterium BMS3Abin06]
MSIPHGHGYGFVAKQFFDFVKINAVLDKPCREGMAHVVEMKVLNPVVLHIKLSQKGGFYSN